MNVFTYGSLMFPEVINALLHRNDYQSCAASLTGYTRLKVKDAVYPGLVKSLGSTVEGVLYLNVEEEDLQILNSFEGS